MVHLRIKCTVTVIRTPEILFPDLEKSRKQSFEDPFSGLSASRDGQILVGVGLNLTEPTKGASTYNWEIMRIEPNGRLTQLTNIKGRIAWPHIAYGGSAVAFGNDQEKRDRAGRFDLFILELRTNRVIATNLLTRLNADPKFAYSPGE